MSAIAGRHELHEIRSCSVHVGSKDGTTEERCVEREDSARIAWAIEEDSTGFGRMVSSWRSGFSLAERDGATIVTAHSTFRPNRPRRLRRRCGACTVSRSNLAGKVGGQPRRRRHFSRARSRELISRSCRESKRSMVGLRIWTQLIHA